MWSNNFALARINIIACRARAGKKNLQNCFQIQTFIFSVKGKFLLLYVEMYTEKGLLPHIGFEHFNGFAKFTQIF